MRSTLLAAAVALSLSLLVSPASGRAGILEWSAGVKAAGGVEIWTGPSGLPIWTAGFPLFDEDRAGWSAGVGIYGELRILKFLAVEIGFDYRYQRLMEDTSINAAKSEETVTWHTLRIPILVKGVLPLGMVRLWVGIGPEFAFGVGSSAELEMKRGFYVPTPKLKARDVNDIYLTTGLGVVVSIGPIAIPIELRFGYNVTQPGGYGGRIGDGLPTDATFTVRASNTMEARLLLGVGYEF